jgi:hypothetical protein
MTEEEKWQRARISRASEMARRALARRDQTGVNHWVAQFAVEVRQLNRITRRRRSDAAHQRLLESISRHPSVWRNPRFEDR